MKFQDETQLADQKESQDQDIEKSFWKEKMKKKEKRAKRIWKKKLFSIRRLRPAHAFGGSAFALALMAMPVSSPAQISPLGQMATQSPNIFVHLADQVVPSVVNISISAKAPKRSFSDPRTEPYRQEFDRFFHFRDPRTRPDPYRSDPGRPQLPRTQAMGTGVIIDVKKKAKGYEGLILTNHHVIADAGAVQVFFSKRISQDPVSAEIVGRDRELDLGLIRVFTEKKLIPLKLGDSDALKVGEFVMAVGNPYGQGHSVSHGIISAKGRNTPMILGRYLQTDAPINPGNSGGPLVNLKGEIIGINNAILAQAQGIGFAIPANEIKTVLGQLKENGKVTRGYIGIQMGEISEQAASFSSKSVKPGQPYVTKVEPRGPAEAAGLRRNDIILEVNNKQVKSTTDLVLEVTALPVGKTAKLTVLRQGHPKTFVVKIGERPIS